MGSGHRNGFLFRFAPPSTPLLPSQKRQKLSHRGNYVRKFTCHKSTSSTVKTPGEDGNSFVADHGPSKTQQEMWNSEQVPLQPNLSIRLPDVSQQDRPPFASPQALKSVGQTTVHCTSPEVSTGKQRRPSGKVDTISPTNHGHEGGGYESDDPLCLRSPTPATSGPASSSSSSSSSYSHSSSSASASPQKQSIRRHHVKPTGVFLETQATAKPFSQQQPLAESACPTPSKPAWYVPPAISRPSSSHLPLSSQFQSTPRFNAPSSSFPPAPPPPIPSSISALRPPSRTGSLTALKTHTSARPRFSFPHANSHTGNATSDGGNSVENSLRRSEGGIPSSALSELFSPHKSRKFSKLKEGGWAEEVRDWMFSVSVSRASRTDARGNEGDGLVCVRELLQSMTEGII